MQNAKPVYGQEAIVIELTDTHLAATSLIEVGPFEETYCVGRIWATADRQLYVHLRIRTSGDVQSAYIPLDDLASGPHTLRIRWAEDRVALRLDQQQEIPTSWKPPPAAPQG